jgi:hypothetical protein
VQYLIFKTELTDNTETPTSGDTVMQLTNKYVGSLANIGQLGRAQICFFAGLVTVSIANAFAVLTIGEDEPTAEIEHSA